MPATVLASAARRGTPGFRGRRGPAVRGAPFPGRGRAQSFRCGPFQGGVFMGTGPGPCGPAGQVFTPEDVSSWFEKAFRDFDDDVFGSSAASCATPFTQRRGSRKMFLDVIEARDAYRILADLPGVAKSDVKLHVDGAALTISVPAPADASAAAAAGDGDADAVKGEGAAQATSEEETAAQEADGDGEERYLARERRAAFAERTVKLPEAADMGRVDAKLERGVLTVTVAKTDDAVRARRAVPIS